MIYLSRIDDVIYVLHCFEKQSRKTDRRDQCREGTAVTGSPTDTGAEETCERSRMSLPTSPEITFSLI